MTGQLPTEELEREHRFIEKVVKACFVMAAEIENGGAADAALLGRVVEFMRLYADRCHHGKEEALLFPALSAKGVPITGCPIAVLSAEHVQGRLLVSGLADALDRFGRGEPDVAKAILETLRGITRLYPITSGRKIICSFR